MQMGKKYMRRYSTSLAIREMQSKSIWKDYFTAHKIAIIKTTKISKYWQVNGRKVVIIHLVKCNVNCYIHYDKGF